MSASRRRTRAPGAAGAIGLASAAACLLLAAEVRGAPSSRPASSRPASSKIGDSAGVPFLARLVARGFFNALLDGDLPALLPLCAEAVDFDGERISGRAPIEGRLRRLIKRAKQRRLKLRRLVLLDRRDMLRHFGAPPNRIGSSARRGRFFALARLDRLGVVAVLARRGRFFRVVALTD